MAVEDDDDLDQFLDPDDFGEAFTWNATTIYGIFDNDSYTVEGANDAPIHIQKPTVLVKTSDIPTMAQGDSITKVRTNQTYTVQIFAPDGTGLTVLGLRGQ
ncbi:hypothetical protein K0U83_09570 [bacterium]|nr:hypothetical protein [bacterium]